jgi:hypothetical protein
MSETERPAFYALSPGGWRDYWTLLHPPYTIWHLSYVAIGAAVAPTIELRWLAETLLGFFFGVGLSAHALDELKGHPLRTRIPDTVLWVIAGIGLAGAVALGIDGALEVSAWIVAFIAMGFLLVIAYNLELFGGAFHTSAWFAIGWGAFPALTSSFVQQQRVSVSAVVVAASCALLSAAQRSLSTPVRNLRRHVSRVSGEVVLDDGRREPIDASAFRAAPEAALWALSLAMPVLGVGLVLGRIG